MTLLLIIWGVWSATKLPIDAKPILPTIRYKYLLLVLHWQGREVEQLVTFPIEQSIANIPNIEESPKYFSFWIISYYSSVQRRSRYIFCKATYKRKNKGSRRKTYPKE